MLVEIWAKSGVVQAQAYFRTIAGNPDSLLTMSETQEVSECA